MKEFLKPYYQRIKDILVEASTENAVTEELTIEVEELKNTFYNELENNSTSNEFVFEGEDAVKGLFKKYDRLFGEESIFVKRDPESRLAIKLNLGLGNINPPCPYSEEEFPDIQKKITEFISQRVKTAENDISRPLLTGEAKTQLSQTQMRNLVNHLVSISHSLTDYVDYYDGDNWNWPLDCVFIVQYVFEKAAEITYYFVKGEDVDELSFDIRESFTNFDISVSEELQKAIDGEVEILENIVMDITSFIINNDYNLCDKETWFRPILFNIALDGMIYTLQTI